MKMLTRVVLLLVLLFPTALVAGSNKMPSAQSICDEIEHEIPGAEFERESHIRLGRVAMFFARPIARWAIDEDEEVRDWLSSIRRVDIATYRVVDWPAAQDAAPFRRIEDRLTHSGWQKLVRTRENDENTWVFYRYRDNGSITGILVVELDDYELSIVGVEGRLDEILADAIAEEPGEFSSLFGS